MKKLALILTLMRIAHLPLAWSLQGYHEVILTILANHHSESQFLLRGPSSILRSPKSIKTPYPCLYIQPFSPLVLVKAS